MNYEFSYELNEVYDYIDDIEVEVPEALPEWDETMEKKCQELPGASYRRGEGDSYRVTVRGTDLQILELLAREWAEFADPKKPFPREETLDAIRLGDLSLRPDGKMI